MALTIHEECVTVCDIRHTCVDGSRKSEVGSRKVGRLPTSDCGRAGVCASAVQHDAARAHIGCGEAVAVIVLPSLVPAVVVRAPCRKFSTLRVRSTSLLCC